MGCNSHLSIEYQDMKSYAPTRWEAFALDLPESRDYSLYTAMAGVRGSRREAIVQPRGIPKDASTPVMYWIKRAGEDGHTHSWLHPDEFHRTIQASHADRSKIWDAIDGVLTTLKTIYGDQHVRLVFFFDN